MRTPLNKKLLGISAASTAFLALPSGAQGQIAYTNFDPDIVLDPDTDPWPHSEYQYYYLDMNADGDVDFTFRAFASVSYSGWLTSNYYMNHDIMWPADRQAFAGYDPGDWYYYASVIGAGALINEGLAWQEDNLPMGTKNVELKRYYHTPGIIQDEGNWGGENGKFIAVRLKTPGQKFYGWIRISVSDLGDSVIIHDFAYNTINNAPINAGETGVALPVPFPYFTQVLSPTQVKVKWEQVAGATSYRIQYREVGAVDWITVKSSAAKSSRIISGLTCGVNYEWHIRAAFGAGSNSEYSDMQYFTPAACRLGDAEIATSQQVDLFPNPTGGLMHISADGFDEDLVEINIVNMSGEIVRTLTIPQNELTVISVDDLPSGTYLMRVHDTNNAVVKRFVIIPE